MTQSPSCLKRLLIILCALLLPAIPTTSFAVGEEGATYDDHFHGQKGTDQIISEGSHVPFMDVQESVDTFSGNVNLLHTDVILPGNGGMDLKIQRVYNSRIWGRTDVSFPGLVANNERSVMGVGWSFHFGRVLNPYGTGSSNRYLPDNPVVEMPDGSSHPLYRDKNNSTQFVTREQWIYRRNGDVFELILTDGTVYTFPIAYSYGTRDGVLVLQVGSIKDTNGNTITFSYNTGDYRLLQSITDSTYRTINFEYTDITSSSCALSSEKALTRMSVNGNVYRYEYSLDCVLLLKKVTPPVGPAWNYEYDTISSPGTGTQLYELKKLKYPSGGEIVYTYGDEWFDTGQVAVKFKVIKERKVQGRGVPSGTWSYAYNANSYATDQTTTVTRPDNATEKYTYFSFSSAGNVSGNLWKVGSLLKKETIDGGSVKETVSNNWSSSAAISYDDLPNGNWNGAGGWQYDYEIYVPLLSSSSVTRDGGTYTTTYSNYDQYGNPGRIEESGDASRTTNLTYFYNTTKNIVKNYPKTRQVLAWNGSTNTTYDYEIETGNVRSVNRDGVMTQFEYRDRGRLWKRTNARGYTTTYDEYQYGVVKKITFPTTPAFSVTRTINWDGTVQSETNGRGYSTSFLYDNLGRLAQVTPPAGAVTTITYDNVGGTYWKVTKGTTFTQSNVDGLGRVTSTSASEGIYTATTYNVLGQKSYQSYPYTTTNIGDSFTYDVLGRVKQVTHPDSKTQVYNYSNSNVAITNERSITTTYGYTAFGTPDDKLLTSVVDATGTTSYAYNAAAQLATITHPNGLTRSFGYDSRKFLISENNPETGTITFGRDEIGNMQSRIDGKGTTSFTYDPLNRLTTVDYPGTADDTTFGYDNADNRTSMSSSTATYSYSFDAINRLTQQSATINGRAYATTFGYDDRSNLTSLGYPSGRSIVYTYDSANRTTGLTGYVSNVTYHPSGGMSGFTYAYANVNVTTTSIGYNNRYWVNSMSVPSILGATYGYDGVGNVQSITDSLNSSKNRSMGYDNVDRLTSASGVWGSMSFGYDAVGNRTYKTVSGSTTNYGYSNNRVSSLSGAETDTYSYDGNGNVTGMRGMTLAYDYANRLTSVNGGTSSYAYDGDGMRIKKTGNGKTTVYHYDAHGNILSESDDTGVFMADYLYLNGKLAVKAVLSPNTPSGLAAQVTAVTPAPTVQLSWTDTNNGTADTIIERKVSGGAYSQIATVTRPSTTFTDNQGLSANNTYYYRVRATNASGVSEAYSSEASAFTTQYTITASAGVNGGITPTGAIVVLHGGNMVFTATANAQYHISSLLVDSNPIAAAVTKTTYTYTFSNVAANHTIEAFFVADVAPDAFSFPSRILVPTSLSITSDPITVSGIVATAAPISITGGEYSIDGGAYTSAAGTVTNGQLVRVRETSSATYSTTTAARLTIGGVSADFALTTVSTATEILHTAWWSTNTGYTSYVMVQNTTNNPVTINATLICRNGTSYIPEPLTLAAKQARSIVINSSQANLAGAVNGAVEVTHTGNPGDIVADLMVFNGGFSLSTGFKKKTAVTTTLHAPWWSTQPGYTSYVMVKNTTNSTVTVNATLLGRNGLSYTPSLTLDPHQARGIVINSYQANLSGEVSGAVEVTYTGNPGDVVGDIMVFGPDGFSLTTALKENVASSSALHTPWWSTNTGYTSYIVVKNTSNTTATVNATLLGRNGTSYTPSFTLTPHQATSIEINSYQANLPGAVNGAVELTHTGNPGDVIGDLIVYGPSGFSLSTDLRENVATSTTLYAPWWSTNIGYTSYVMVKNTTNNTITVNATLLGRNGTSYTPSLTLDPHQARGIVINSYQADLPGAVNGAVEVTYTGNPGDIVGDLIVFGPSGFSLSAPLR